MQRRTPPEQAPPVHREGIKETIESIVVALILAFVFRAFVVEAFVIPTGSMAPTLYGAHGTIVCEDCGTEFAYGLRDLSDERRASLVGGTARAVCPNCDHANSDLLINDFQRNPEAGDRILVFKWPYDIGGSRFAPARWDVVVFKDPADGQTNFIKRLVGRPNEVLTIIDGDPYTAPLADLSERALTEFERLRRNKYELRIGASHGRLGKPRPNILKELDEKLRIARKTEAAQESLWCPVFNNDFPPRTLDHGQPSWRAALKGLSGWNTTKRRLHFDDRGEPMDGIELGGKLIQASCSYNVHGPEPPMVSDLRVRFVFVPATPHATVQVRLEKHGRRFWATLSSSGLVTICETPAQPTTDTTPLLTANLSPLEPGRPVEVSFENVDYRLALYVGGEQVLATNSDADSPAFYGPNVAQLRLEQNDPQPSSIPQVYGVGGSFDLMHLVVERDVYYYLSPGSHALALDWAPSDGWGSADSPILLRDGEYFMLGDNTAASKDSRLWDTLGPHLVDRGEDYQLGTVPEDQLIGKAFFVYWPSPNRIDWLEWLPVVRGGLIPNVGRMRWIR